jgi:hypothetical protein
MTRAFFQFRRIFFCVPDGPASASASGERCAVDDYLKHRRITRRPSIATSSGGLLSKASVGMLLKNDQ